MSDLSFCPWRNDFYAGVQPAWSHRKYLPTSPNPINITLWYRGVLRSSDLYLERLCCIVSFLQAVMQRDYSWTANVVLVIALLHWWMGEAFLRPVTALSSKLPFFPSCCFCKWSWCMRGTFMGKGAHVCCFYSKPTKFITATTFYGHGSLMQAAVSPFDCGFPYPYWDTRLEPWRLNAQDLSGEVLCLLSGRALLIWARECRRKHSFWLIEMF